MRKTTTAQMTACQFSATVVETVRPSAPEPTSALQPGPPHVPDHPPRRADSISIHALRLRRNEVRQAGGLEDYNRMGIRLWPGWAFLLLVPVVAVFVSIFAVLADVFFARPFPHRTSDREGLHPDRPRTERGP